MSSDERCTPVRDQVNAEIRAFLRARRGRRWTVVERREYARLLETWVAASRDERTTTAA